MIYNTYKRKLKRPPLTAALKMNTIKFLIDHGVLATQAQFKLQHGVSISRSTLYSWKKLYDRFHNHGALIDILNPLSKRPRKVKVSTIDKRIIDKIIELRHLYPILGKEKLYVMLIPFCEAEGLKMIGKTTIGKIIRKLKISRSIPTDKANFDVNINGATGQLEIREIKAKMRKKKNRKPKEHKAKFFGDIVQCDAITYYIGNVKRYFVCCIDIHTRVVYAKAYTTLNSANATDCLSEFERRHKIKIGHVQTDNGLEYHKYFDEYLTAQNIKHYWNYPACPKMNAFIERFNRTIEDEFIDWRLKDLKYLKVSEFNQLLEIYLDYYNNIRPHASLQYATPMEVYRLSI